MAPDICVKYTTISGKIQKVKVKMDLMAHNIHNINYI
jgi:hypothetical protein